MTISALGEQSQRHGNHINDEDTTCYRSDRSTGLLQVICINDTKELVVSAVTLFVSRQVNIIKAVDIVVVVLGIGTLMSVHRNID